MIKRSILYEQSIANLLSDVIKKWNEDRNNTDASQYTAGSEYKAWWKCKLGHEWMARIADSTKGGCDCLICYKNKII